MSSIRSSEFTPSQQELRGLYVSIMHSALHNTDLPTDIYDEYLAGVRSVHQTTVLGGLAVAEVCTSHGRPEFDEMAVKLPLAMHGTSDPNWVHVTLQNGAETEKPARGLTFAFHRYVSHGTSEMYEYQLYKYLPAFDDEVFEESERMHESELDVLAIDGFEEHMHAITDEDMALLGLLATELARKPSDQAS